MSSQTLQIETPRAENQSKRCIQCLIDRRMDDFYTNGKLGHHTRCKPCTSENRKLARLSNIELSRKQDREKYKLNKESKKQSIKRWYEKNRDKKLKNERERYLKKSDHIKTQHKEYRALNRSKIYALNGKRRQAEKIASVPWADKNEIAKLYEWAEFLKEETGINYHVDHIIPLRGRNVCGLHIHQNMQVITATENIKKGASFVPV